MKQVSKIIIIIIIIIMIIINKNKNKKIKGRSERTERVRRERLRGFYFFISFFVSFSDLRKSDRRFSSGLKAKLIHASRATRGHQNLGVSSNSTR